MAEKMIIDLSSGEEDDDNATIVLSSDTADEYTLSETEDSENDPIDLDELINNMGTDDDQPMLERADGIEEGNQKEDWYAAIGNVEEVNEEMEGNQKEDWYAAIGNVEEPNEEMEPKQEGSNPNLKKFPAAGGDAKADNCEVSSSVLDPGYDADEE